MQSFLCEWGNGNLFPENRKVFSEELRIANIPGTNFGLWAS